VDVEKEVREDKDPLKSYLPASLASFLHLPPGFLQMLSFPDVIREREMGEGKKDSSAKTL